MDVQPGLAQVIASASGGNATRYVHDPSGIHGSEDSSGNWSFYLKDGLGSVREVRNGAVQGYDYSPYGTPDTLPTDFGYTGEWTDANGLNYRRARYYDPSLGVWLSLDPLEVGNLSTVYFMLKHLLLIA